MSVFVSPTSIHGSWSKFWFLMAIFWPLGNIKSSRFSLDLPYRPTAALKKFPNGTLDRPHMQDLGLRLQIEATKTALPMQRDTSAALSSVMPGRNLGFRVTEQ